MTKDEMKDKISMALKDPVLQQGFEIICKENAELKAKIEKMKKDFSNALDSAYSNQALYELWLKWEIK